MNTFSEICNVHRKVATSCSAYFFTHDATVPDDIRKETRKAIAAAWSKVACKIFSDRNTTSTVYGPLVIDVKKRPKKTLKNVKT